ncbi:MAG: HAMP domain-containing protein [Bacteroidetes bacterium]|nr:HAMP domain-containing protein [Bacteroidota bacterium]
MKIRTKITTVYVVLAILMVAAIGIFTSLWMESFFKIQLVNELSRQADLVLYILREDSTRSFTQIDEQIKKVSGLEHLRVTLIDDRGNVIADSDIPLAEITRVENHLERPEVQEAKRMGIGHDIRRSATVDRDFLYMAKEIRKPLNSSHFRNLRYIRLSSPYEQVQRQIDQIRSIVIIIGFLALLAIIIVSIFVSRRITHPMAQIVKGVEQIRLGELDARVPVKSKDEIGLAATAINELVDKLNSDIIQLKKLEQVRSQFLGNVSHELRTPIFSAQGYLETLLGGAINDPSVNRSFIEKAQNNLNRLHTLLEDLINISQIESGEMKMSFRIFYANEFIESVFKEFQSLAVNRNLTLRLVMSTKPEDEIFGDRERLRQVLNNLLSNAINYNKPGGEVVLSSERTGTGIQISVKDTGVGIPQEHISRIFERFYRVDSDRSRELGGTGLGLAIVKHIIEAHGSHVDVESKAGEGSTFWFVLKSG